MSGEVERYTAIKAKADDAKLKKAQAEARLEDAKKKAAEMVAEITAAGYPSVGALKDAIDLMEAELKVLLDEADKKLTEAGF